MRSFLLVALVALGLAAAVRPAVAQDLTDCPVKGQPYSTESLFIDLLRDPAARAVLEARAPDLLTRVPPSVLNTTRPSLAAVLTPRAIALHLDLPLAIEAVDRALAALPVSAAADADRCSGYDLHRLAPVSSAGRPAILVFDKTSGYRDQAAIDAAAALVRAVAAKNGWSVLFVSDGGAITSAQLAEVDAVVWNNVSGDVLSLSQRAALEAFVTGGGGFVGLHGAGGDHVYSWSWYADALIGARFIGHPRSLQFQAARVRVSDRNGPITRGLPSEWTMTDEWYSFATDPQTAGARVLLELDEASYRPDIDEPRHRMGHHPIAWTRCVGAGRSFYDAIGHRPESYTEPNNARLIAQGLRWAIGQDGSGCEAGREVSAP
jgi:type 1 glutamine amidotransferase